MNWCKKHVLSIALMIVVFVSMLVISPSAVAQTTQPGPASDKIIARRYAIADVPTVIAKGDIDAYMYALRPAQAEQLRGVSGVTLISAAAGLIELTLNNAPVHIERLPGKLTADEVIAQLRQRGINVPLKALVNLYYEESGGTTYTVAEFGAFPGKGVNPFAFREIRLAMNYIVDRSTFASVVMRGFAVPMYTFLSPYDPDYALIADIIAKYEFEYNPTYAKQIVERVMKEIGATMEGGVWKYEGKPVTLTLIIRPEDERRDLGYMFNTELKLLGFDTTPRELPFAQAIDVVYGSDPMEFRWHVYTAGWGKSGIDKYDSGTIAQFCAPWVGYMPGWQETTFWNYRNETLDNLTQRIYQGNYKSKQERDELYRTATEMCIQESIRIWVAARLDTWPVRAEVKGVTLDIGAGLRGIWNLREMYREDRRELYVGHLYVWTATSEWNIWGGFTDVYSVDWERATYDPSSWNHPFNGRPIPFRVQWAVFTAGPDGQLDVPPTAKVWDVNAKQWVNVGAGVKARSKVIIDLSKFIDAKWHNGMKITMADIVGYVALIYEIVYNPVYSALEPRIASNTKPWLDTVKGWEFNDQAKTMTVYVDYWHFDEAYIGAWAVVTPINPIEIHVASFELALDRRNETNIVLYRRSGYETLSLVVPKHVSLIKDTLSKYKNNNAVLEKVNRLTDGRMSMSEWNSRIDADVNWINTYGLAWISQGPFMLTKLDTTAQVLELTAYRDPTYPFKKGDWYFGYPVRTEIVSVEISTPVKDKIAIGYDAIITTKLSGLPPFQLKYILRDPAGNIVATGYGEKTAEDTFVVKLPADLTKTFKPDTPYTLILIGVSDQVAEPGVVRRVLVATQYEVTPTTPTTPITTPTTPITTPTTPVTTPTTPTTTPTTTPAPAPSILPYVVVAVVIVVVLAVVFVLRKK
ncbi:MAG: ABC transporter substrate-binding protein [Desulfurococcaceae archaeon]